MILYLFFDVLTFFLFNFLWEDSIRNDQQTSNWLVIVMVNVFLDIVLLCWLLLPGEFPYMPGRCPNAWNHHWSTNPPVTYWFPSIRPAIKPKFPRGRYVAGGGWSISHPAGSQHGLLPRSLVRDGGFFFPAVFVSWLEMWWTQISF